MVNDAQLIFVYNADSGLFNAMADVGHKIFSPTTYPCQLCALTYGLLTERKQWRRFIESLPAACEFLHRDQVRQRYPELDEALPAVFFMLDDKPVVCVSAAQLTACSTLDALQDLIRTRCISDLTG